MEFGSIDGGEDDKHNDIDLAEISKIFSVSFEQSHFAGLLDAAIYQYT